MTEEIKPPAEVTFEEFTKLNFVVGTINEVTEHPKADKLVVLQVNIGNNKIVQVVAGIKQHYTPEELKGKQIIVLINLKPVELRGVRSEGMLLAASAQDGDQKLLSLMGPDRIIAAGSKVS